MSEQKDEKQLELFPDLPKSTDGNQPVKEKKYFEHPEWCYQFFDDEPVVFAFPQFAGEPYNKESLQISVEPTDGGALVFSSKGMLFKIFARPISQKSLEELERTKKAKAEQDAPNVTPEG